MSRSFPVAFDLVRTSPNELRIDLTADEDISGVTLAVAALATISVVEGVRVGKEELTVETVCVLNLTNNVVQSSIVSGIRGNVVTTELVIVLAPQTGIVVHSVLSNTVVGSGIISRTSGDVGAIGRLVLVVGGVVAVLLIEVERAFTLSRNISEVRDSSKNYCVTISFSFYDTIGRGVVTFDFIRIFVSGNEYTSNSTLYSYAGTVLRT